MRFILRLLYILWGKLILLPICYKYAGHDNLPVRWHYYDNAEDGFSGNKRGWYDNYLGITAANLPRWKQAWYAYRWSAWRNPAWNLRFHPYLSIPINDDTVMSIKGNTVSHDWKEGRQWYDVVSDGKYSSHFRLIPISKNKSLYLRWGWKIYPEFYQKKIPKYKSRSIQAITIRIRGKEL